MTKLINITYKEVESKNKNKQLKIKALNQFYSNHILLKYD